MRYALRVAVGVAKAEHRRHAWPVQDIVDVGATSLQGLVLLGCIGRGQPGAGIDTCGRIARCGQLVPELDFDLIRSNPKPFVGASDVTVLHAAIRRFCGLTTFYGPGLTKINAVGTPPLNQESLLRAVTSTEPLGQVPRNPDDQYIRTLAGGKASGEFAGGALWVLCQTIGTPWQIDLNGKILLLGEIGESPWRMDALLRHLRQAGVLEGVAGVVVSELVDCDWSERPPEDPQTLSIEEVLARHIQPLDVPTIYGHGKHLFTTPLGAGATLDADRQTLSITEPALASPPEAGAQTTSHA